MLVTEFFGVLPGVTGRILVSWPVLPCPPLIPMYSPRNHTLPILQGIEAFPSSTDYPVPSPQHSALLHLPTREVGVVKIFGPGSGHPRLE